MTSVLVMCNLNPVILFSLSSIRHFLSPPFFISPPRTLSLLHLVFSLLLAGSQPQLNQQPHITRPSNLPSRNPLSQQNPTPFSKEKTRRSLCRTAGSARSLDVLVEIREGRDHRDARRSTRKEVRSAEIEYNQEPPALPGGAR